MRQTVQRLPLGLTGTITDLKSWHLPRLKVIVDSNPDLLAVETIPVVREAEAILDCLQQFPTVKAWVTFQCKDGGHTGHGEDIKDAIKAVTKSDQVVAVGVNCVHPEYVTELMQNIFEVVPRNIPVIVKPNGGVFEHDGERCKTKHNLSDYVLKWLGTGATWIGGCCHITPSDIAEIRKTLESVSDIKFMQQGDKLV